MMRKRHVVGALIAAAIPLGAFVPAQAAPARNEATVISHVTIDKSDPSVGYVRARYTCQPEIDHLWVSVKQNDSATVDPQISAEGSGFGDVATAWWQSHRGTFTCAGKRHVAADMHRADDVGVAEGERVVGALLGARGSGHDQRSRNDDDCKHK